jgi:HK97 family phage prohead protease
MAIHKGESMDTKVCPITSFKFVDQGDGSFVGYGNVFGIVDLQNEVTVPGCFKDSIPDWISKGHVFLNHDRNVSIATVNNAYEDPYGLKFEATFLSNSNGQNARIMMADRLKRGKETGLSIGYQALSSRKRYDGAVMLEKVRLQEVSVLTVRPANEASRVLEVKGALAEQFRSIQAKCAREKVEADKRKIAMRMIVERMNSRHRQMGLIR